MRVEQQTTNFYLSNIKYSYQIKLFKTLLPIIQNNTINYLCLLYCKQIIILQAMQKLI